jgi:uncharacterized protein YciI
VAEWIYFLHAPREHFAETMSAREAEVFAEHFAYLESLLAAGVLVLAGPTLGAINTGLAVLRASDEAAARAIMAADPAVAAGVVTGELRGFRVSLLAPREPGEP